jgi:hypothetical protein
MATLRVRPLDGRVKPGHGVGVVGRCWMHELGALWRIGIVEVGRYSVVSRDTVVMKLTQLIHLLHGRA